MANASNYDIGGIGPNTNSTHGYFQYLVADEVLVDNEVYANKVNVDNNILVKGRVKASEVELVTFVDEGFDDSSHTSFQPPKLLSTLFDDVTTLQSDFTDLEERVTTLESAGFTGTVDLSGILTRISNLENIELPPVDLSAIELRLTNLEDAELPPVDLSAIELRLTNLEDTELPPVDLSNIESRLTALEGIDFTPPDLSNLTNSITALQTRTGTLESLIGLLNNNNPTDTALENRITNLETKINALISIYNSIKAIHNMPINL